MIWELGRHSNRHTTIKSRVWIPGAHASSWESMVTTCNPGTQEAEMSYLGQAGQQNCLQSGSSKLIDIHCLNKFRLRVMENAPDICEPWACTHLFTCTHTYICIQRHNKNKLSKDMFQAVYLSRCWEHLWSTARQWLIGGRTQSVVLVLSLWVWEDCCGPSFLFT